MEWSQYNYFYKLKTNKEVVLYNTLSGAVLIINEQEYNELKRLKEDIDLLPEYHNKELLISNKIIVENNHLEKQLFKFNIIKNRFNPKNLNLVLFPTFSCNFDCLYCYEKNIIGSAPNINTETLDNIILFIKRFSEVENLFIHWFGGEPLLAYDTIKSFTKKLLSTIKCNYQASIFSNGYLFNEKIITNLEKLCINNIQLTIDGTENIHNQRRGLFNGSETFKKIIENTHKIFNFNKNIRIQIRVNIDYQNASSYHLIYFQLMNEFAGKKIIIYPGFVFTKQCNSSLCFDPKLKKIQFLIKQSQEYKIPSFELYLETVTNNCLVRNLNSFSIDTQGNLYKCNVSIGDPECIIGNINKTKYIENNLLNIKYLKDKDYLDNEKCNECIFLPICKEDCPILKFNESYNMDEYCDSVKIKTDHYLKTLLIENQIVNELSN